MKIKQAFLFGIIVMVCATAVRSEGKAFVFPDTVQGRRAAAYFTAFNASGEGAMAAFLRDNLSAAALQRASLEERLARFRGSKQEARELAVERALRATPDSASYLARSGNGEFIEFTFQFEKGPEARIVTIFGAPIDPEVAVDLAGPPLARDEVLARVGRALDERSRDDSFSGVVLVARGDTVLLLKACGLASSEYAVPNLVDTRFNLGSINKLFTRLAIGQLAEKGALALDDTIGKFLPDYPNREAAAKVTVRQLLDMTSGIGDFFGEKYEATTKGRIRDLEDYLPLFATQPLLFVPGSQRRYSNGGYVVLGLIVAKASGQSYFDYVREHIYVPAGMTATGHLEADVPQANVASGYTRGWDDGDHAHEPRRSNVYTRPARGSSAGGGYSTAMDLFRFTRALRAGRLLGPLAAEWFSGSQAYAGGAPGINAALDIDPVPGWTVVVLGNYDPPAATSLAQRISGWLRAMGAE
jgi:CubicO group peptidase (beta-lactamase class C family)